MKRMFTSLYPRLNPISEFPKDNDYRVLMINEGAVAVAFTKRFRKFRENGTSGNVILSAISSRFQTTAKLSKSSRSLDITNSVRGLL